MDNYHWVKHYSWHLPMDQFKLYFGILVYFPTWRWKKRNWFNKNISFVIFTYNPILVSFYEGNVWTQRWTFCRENGFVSFFFSFFYRLSSLLFSIPLKPCQPPTTAVTTYCGVSYTEMDFIKLFFLIQAYYSVNTDRFL